MTADSIFLPEEASLIKAWLSLADPLGRDLSVEWGTEVQPPYGAPPNSWGSWNEWSLSAAVASILLNRIQGRLPQWAAVYDDGTIKLGRTPQPKKARRVYLYPRLLLEINWADSGPGFSNPDAYHLTYLPLHDKFVVTSSSDSPYVFSGYVSHAIGYFPATDDILASCGSILKSFWEAVYNEGGDQEPWGGIFETGLVTSELAYEWQESVWPWQEEDDDDEEEEDEDEDDEEKEDDDKEDV